MDYADWLTPERLEVEERLWARDKVYERYANGIRRLASQYPIRNVVELGCGTGWVPTALDTLELADYACIDRNPGCLALARQKNAERAWVRVIDMDIRTASPVGGLVCSFAVLKHFRLPEWEGLFRRIFSGAEYGLFTMPIADRSMEDGVEFTHTWLSESDLAAALSAAGHVELWRDTTDVLEPIIATKGA